MTAPSRPAKTNGRHRMTRISLLLASCLLSAGCGEDPISRVTPRGESPDERLTALEEDTDGIEATIAAFNTAFDRTDVGRLTSLFTETADIYLYDGNVIRARQFGVEMSPIWSNWSNMETRYRIQGMKAARPYAWAKFVETFSFDADGKTHTMENLVTMTFERRGKTWLISHMHLSTANPP